MRHFWGFTLSHTIKRLMIGKRSTPYDDRIKNGCRFGLKLSDYLSDKVEFLHFLLSPGFKYCDLLTYFIVGLNPW